LTSRPASAPPFYTRYGFARTGDRDAPLTLAPYPPVCRHGALRATIVAAAVDLVGSLFTREIAGSDFLFTTDLSVRMPCADVPEALRVRGRVLRSGRTGVTTGVELCAGETLWAYGETSFARQPRAAGSTVTAAELALPRVFERHPLERPLEEEVGVEIVDAARGEVELALRPVVLNRDVTLQGALVALLVECAAERLAEHVLDGPQRIAELDLRYLSTAKVGPVRSRASFVGDPAAGMIRAELRDAGRDERLTATALLRAVPAS
jgi:acyl-coenzyme A thioesterase PaaI-like protein